MDWQPSCAICGSRFTPAFPGDCHHEADALTKALHQALDRSETIQRIKDWVIDNAKRQIGANFDNLRRARLEYHTAYIQRLPCYSLYQSYRGNPPSHMPQLQAVKIQIAQAQTVLAQGVDEDWRRSCMEYPRMLDYYFGLVEVEFPGQEERCVRSPVFGGSPAPTSRGGEARRKNRRGSGEKEARRKERRRSRARTRTPPRAPSVGRYR